MGVYIKGVTKSQLMKVIINSTEFMPDDFEVIEVKTPHGRLIDADKAEEKEWKYCSDDLPSVSIYPTVIEAEPDEDCRTCKNYNTEKCNMCGVEADYYEAEVE